VFVVITGTIGAGKDTVANYLVNQHNFVFSSGSQIIALETKKKDLELNRENMHRVANDLRKKSSTEIVERSIEKAHGADKVVIGFLRTENTVSYIKENFPEAFLLGLDAPVELRYQRTQDRKEYKDNMTLEEFKEFKDKEMKSDDPDKQNIFHCLRQSDHIIINNRSLKDLYKKVTDVLEL